MKLLIRNLARTTTETELRAKFEAYGAVQSCTLVMDKKTGNSKGFGFVEMPKPGDAKDASGPKTSGPYHKTITQHKY